MIKLLSIKVDYDVNGLNNEEIEALKHSLLSGCNPQNGSSDDGIKRVITETIDADDQVIRACKFFPPEKSK